MEFITRYLDQYGYIVLFFALLLEMLALPLPGELLMSYSGYLVFQGHLHETFTILIAGTGVCVGKTIAYWIGFKLGTSFFDKYGPRLHMGPRLIEKTSHWFNRHGNKLLIIAYFIPGFRHMTGYFSGITQLSFRSYALFTYSGAFLWVTVFIALGNVLGPQWAHFHTLVTKYLIIATIAAVFVLGFIYFYKKKNMKLRPVWVRVVNLFYPWKRGGLLIALTVFLTLGLMIVIIGIL